MNKTTEGAKQWWDSLDNHQQASLCAEHYGDELEYTELKGESKSTIWIQEVVLKEWWNKFVTIYGSAEKERLSILYFNTRNYPSLTGDQIATIYIKEHEGKEPESLFEKMADICRPKDKVETVSIATINHRNAGGFSIEAPIGVLVNGAVFGAW